MTEASIARSKIYVAGCPHSGVDLVMRLFHGFQGVTHVDHSVDVSFEFVAASRLPGVWRTNNKELLSQDEWEIAGSPRDQIRRLREGGVDVVFIRRNRDALILSGDPDDLGRRHDSCEEQALDCFDDISIMAYVEDIIEFPDEEQRRFADALGLKIASPWSRYPTFVPLKHRGLPPDSPEI